MPDALHGEAPPQRGFPSTDEHTFVRRLAERAADQDLLEGAAVGQRAVDPHRVTRDAEAAHVVLRHRPGPFLARHTSRCPESERTVRTMCVQACLHTLLFVAVRCNHEERDLQHVSVWRSLFQLVDPDF